MATALDKDLTRESTVKIDEREVLVTLTKDQVISFKLKGMKSGQLSISIEDLYNQLKGDIPKVIKPTGSISVSNEKEVKQRKGVNMISLEDLRSHNLISVLDYETKVKFDTLINNFME